MLSGLNFLSLTYIIFWFTRMKTRILIFLILKVISARTNFAFISPTEGKGRGSRRGGGERGRGKGKKKKNEL